VTPTPHDHQHPHVVLARNVRFRYAPGAFQLDIEHFALNPRQHTAVIGPSGCGKTTLLRLLTGALAPDAGAIHTLGADLTRLSPTQRRALRIRRIGMIFQDFALLEYLTALDNILLPYRLGAALKLDEQTLEHAHQLARALGIEPHLRRKPARLSRGEHQRVAIARALITRPSLLVCDEPTAALDPERSLSALDLLLHHADDAHATVLAVTHDHALLDRFQQVRTLDQLAPKSTTPTAAGASP